MSVNEKRSSSTGSGSGSDDSIRETTITAPSANIAAGPKSPFSGRSIPINIADNERVPGSPFYYQKDGLRTEGDEQDHSVEPKLTTRRFLTFVAMAMLWTGSQIPTFLFGSIPPEIYDDIGGQDRYIWYVLAHLLSLAATTPFVGSMSDLVGRRYMALIGCFFIIIGNIICSTAPNMNAFIGGMVFSGVGAGMNELTAISATAEMAPTSKRGIYVGGVIMSLIPFLPSVLYAQLIAEKAGWRYVGILCGAWSAIAFVMTWFLYRPPPRPNSAGLSRREILRQIDWLGGLLSTSGVILFLAGVQWGGYQYHWKSAHVLVPMILGAVLLIAFVVWEGWFASYPLFPKRLHKNSRNLAILLIITCISGANYYAILMFWPTQGYNMYGHDPVQQGIRGLPSGFGLLGGAVLSLGILSVFRGGLATRIMLLVSTILMTAGTGAMAVASPTNQSTILGLLFIAGFGVGGIVVPCTIIVTIICPDDLIATVSALTLAVRVIGGGIGYTIYYNVFVAKLVPNLIHYVGGACVKYLHIYDVPTITKIIKLTAASQIGELAQIQGIGANETAYKIVVEAGVLAFTDSYRYIYYVALGFGGASIIAACFMGDISKYVDDHVAVVME